jgi:C4-dicarboxylate-specific signal transduction histidine kinase
LDGEYFKLDAVKYTSYYGNKTTIRNFTGIPLKEEGKKKLLVIVEDITVSKQVEEELDKYRQHLQNLVEELVKEHNAILVETNEQLREEITEHKQAEQKIKCSSEKLRDLFNLLQSVKNGNKSHITHEIHNTLEQLITAVQIELSDWK